MKILQDHALELVVLHHNVNMVPLQVSVNV